MKNVLLLFCLSLLLFACTPKAAVIVLESNQSMCITGKGQGQDGAINPYIDRNSIAKVENLGENTFSVRVQEDYEVLQTITLKAGEKQSIPLSPGKEIYFDSDLPAEAGISFVKAR